MAEWFKAAVLKTYTAVEFRSLMIRVLLAFTIGFTSVWAVQHVHSAPVQRSYDGAGYGTAVG